MSYRYRSPSWMPLYRSSIDAPTATSFFGPRPKIGNGFHPGLDMQTSGAPRTPGSLTSAADGTIAGVFRYRDGTNNVLVVGDDGRTILYSGLSARLGRGVLGDDLKVGDRIAAAAPVAETGNTDSHVWHTHLEVLNSLGTQALGLSRNDAGNWLLNGRPLSPDNQVSSAGYVGATRTGVERNPYRLEHMLPPEILFPQYPVMLQPNRVSESEKWPEETWESIAQDRAANWGRSTRPLPYLGQPEDVQKEAMPGTRAGDDTWPLGGRWNAIDGGGRPDRSGPNAYDKRSGASSPDIDPGTSIDNRFESFAPPSPDRRLFAPAAVAPRGLPGMLDDYIEAQVSQKTQPGSAAFDHGALPLPFVPQDDAGFFADRFGNRIPARRLSSRWDRL